MSRRRLGLPTLTAIVVANMVGVGVFTTSGFALADLGSPRAVMLAWLVGGVLALLGALCYGALAAYWRESGGEYLFLSRSLHPHLGFLAGWVSLFAGFTGAIAAAAEGAEAYLGTLLPGWIPQDVFGAGMILLAGGLHAVRVGPGARLQNLAVLVKLLLLVAMVIAGAWVLLSEPGAGADGGAPTLGAHPAAQPGLGTFAITLMWISLSYSGWNAAVYVAGEAREPERTLPRALLLGCAAVVGLYLAWNAVVLAAAPPELLAGRQDVAALAAEQLVGPFGGNAVRLVVVLALWTSVSGMVMVGPRVYARMAEDGCLPRFLAFRGATPRAAIGLQVVLALVLLLATDLREQLTNLGWILSLSTAVTVIGLLRERRRVGAAALPILGGPVVAWVFVLATLGLTAVALQTRPIELGYAVGVLGSGVLVAWLTRRDRGAA